MHFKGLRDFTLILLFALVVSPLIAGDLPPQAVQAALPELEKLIEQTMKSTGVPGLSVAVVFKDQVVYLKGFGVKEVGTEAKVDADTVFMLASVSKPVASTVLAALVGEGLIKWDDRIIDHDPGFQMYDSWVTRQVTLRDMLCHRSGLVDHAGDLLEDLGFSRAEILYRLRYSRPGSSFRTESVYTNFGYSEAGFAGVKPTGKSWEEVATQKLFSPLGMKSSSYRFADYEAAQNRALLHVRDKGKWVHKHVRQPDAQAPAGGASSTARDMAQFLRLQLAAGKFEGKQVVATEALAETHRPQIINHQAANPAVDRAGACGLGWNVNVRDDGRITWGHSGAFGLGAATVVTLLPGESLGIVVLTNGEPMGVPESIGMSFIDLALTGKLQRDWLAAMQPVFNEIMKPPYGNKVDYTKPPTGMLPPLPLNAYVGKYHNDYYGDLEVLEKDKTLHLRVGPKFVFPMRHWDRDIFTYQPVGENAGGLSGVTFMVGPDRQASRVIVENLDVTMQGTFIRVAEKK
ncbi:MAG TPA: serine hydrolase [Gemmatales bacterium]|nr:serine hydrolase [Gemmatales bacterium]